MERHIYNDKNKLLVTIQLEFFPKAQQDARDLRDKINGFYGEMVNEISVVEDKYTKNVIDVLEKYK